MHARTHTRVMITTPQEVHIQLLPCSYYQHVLSLFCSHCVPQVGKTALMEASSHGHSDAIQVLISAGAEVDLQAKVSCSICVLQTS